MPRTSEGVKLCYRHHGFDSDGDGQCGKYATAPEEMRRIMQPCVFDPGKLWESPKEEKE